MIYKDHYLCDILKDKIFIFFEGFVVIESIILKNCATYSTEGACIADCKKINFIYGPNGSGKTTISNFLANQYDSKFSSCDIKWKGDTPLDILVYNKQFRSQNFKEEIDGIFTLGKATIKELEDLEELKKQRSKIDEILLGHRSSLSRKEQEKNALISKFREKFWNGIFKQNDKDFPSIFQGFRGNKEKLMNEVIRRYNIVHSSSETRDGLLKRAKTLFSSNLLKIDLLPVVSNSLLSEINQIETDQIWGKSIVGNNDIPIAKLIDFFGNSDWVKKGRSYIRENSICPFCQQETITEDFKHQIELFFSGEYEKNIKRIQELRSSYEYSFTQLLDYFRSLSTKLTNLPISNLDIKSYNSSISLLESMFANSVSLMSSKENEPSIKITISESCKQISEMIHIISSANAEIKIHNRVVENIQEERSAINNEIWTYLISTQEILIEEYLKGLSNIEKALIGMRHSIDECMQELSNINDEILVREKNVTSVEPTVNEINRLLIAYGFTNFKIVKSPDKENCYQIQRPDGTLANTTLSEGEETFVTFLYFMQLAKGSTSEEKVSSKKVLVLDDPICSLDSTVLYIVSSIVKSLIKEIRDDSSDVKQLFIMTHNVFFHKEASYIDGRATKLKDVNYWIISKDSNISTIRPYGMTNPIKTSYELLWNELKSNSNISPINVQNIMRRIIENYFGILGNNINDEIVGKFETIQEQMICRSLISWINDGSHSIPEDLYIDNNDTVKRYKKVFELLFEKMGHKAHYDMMMGVADGKQL